VLDVALEVPLRLLALGGLLQRDHVRAARVQVLGEPLDRAALARRVAPLEDHDQPLPGFLDPVLELEQLDLQQPLVLVVLGPRHPLVVGVVLPPRVHGGAVVAQQHGIVLVGVVDAELGEQAGHIGQLGHNSDIPPPVHTYAPEREQWR
jgi:hypothetical protein